MWEVDVGDGFEAQPEQLRAKARTHLGQIIEKMEESQKALNKTDGHLDLFKGGSSIFEDIEPYWSDTRHYLERVLSDNMENLRLTKEAVEEIADRYESDDQQMAENLNRVGS